MIKVIQLDWSKLKPKKREHKTYEPGTTVKFKKRKGK